MGTAAAPGRAAMLERQDQLARVDRALRLARAGRGTLVPVVERGDQPAGDAGAHQPGTAGRVTRSADLELYVRSLPNGR